MDPLAVAFRALGIDWVALDSWTVLIGALSGMSCALLGTFLVLRKMSMMGDAISHAVLPGLAAAFLITSSRGSLTMLIGAGIVGLLTTLLTQWIHSAGKVDTGAAMGVVFTVLFAIGLILIRRAADHVDLDPECVLYGALEYAVLDQVTLLGIEVPRAVLTIGGVFALNVLAVGLLFKELRITSFDPALATTLGINSTVMHYLLMTLVAVTTVAAFESVGSILVIAMLIAPPAAAHLLTERLAPMLWVSVLMAALAAIFGHAAALVVPPWLGFAGASANTAGMMGVLAGLLFGLAALLAPRHGVLSRLAHRMLLTLRIVREDILGLLYRLEERGRSAPRGALPRMLSETGSVSALTLFLAFRWLRARGLTRRDAGALHLTERGRAAALELVRSHRLWETYLDRNLELPSSHLHRPAAVLEHVTDTRLSEQLAESVADARHDPHGTEIPR